MHYVIDIAEQKDVILNKANVYPSWGYEGQYDWSSFENAIVLASMCAGPHPSCATKCWEDHEGLHIDTDIGINLSDAYSIAALAMEYGFKGTVIFHNDIELIFSEYRRKGTPFIASASQIRAQFWGM